MNGSVDELTGLRNDESEGGPILPLVRIQVKKGYTMLNLFTFFYASLISISALAFINGALPYLLANFLYIPEGKAGSVTANILVMNEAIIIATASLWGIASDYYGRKLIYVIGLFLIGTSFMLHPLARSIGQVFAIRAIFSLGAAATTSMLTSLLGDYPTQESRGRVSGIMGLNAGLGALLGVFVFLKVPSWVGGSFWMGGEIMYWSIGGVILCSCSILLCGLSDKVVNQREHKSLWITIKEGLLAARNPRISISYVASFAARGDAIVITTFISLWINEYLKDINPQEALSRVATVSGTAQTAALIGAPIFGILADHIDRVVLQGASALLAVIGYLWMFLLSDPTSNQVLFAAVIVGLGEIAMIILSQFVVASEAPKSIRGSVSGFFGLCGSIGILVCSLLGGKLFDLYPTSPFLVVAVFNFIVFLLCVVLAMYERHYGTRKY